jgi:hypothetical protein
MPSEAMLQEMCVVSVSGVRKACVDFLLYGTDTQTLTLLLSITRFGTTSSDRAASDRSGVGCKVRSGHGQATAC